MANSRAIRLFPDPVRSLAFGAIVANYTGVGTAFSDPVRILRIQNLTDALLWISFDGVNNHEAMASNSFLLLDVTANKAREDGCYLPDGTRIYAKRNETPTSGDVYVTAYTATR